MATEFQFMGEFALGSAAYSSRTQTVTVTANIDDGTIDVGDAVTMSGLSIDAGFSFNGGFDNGETLYYHGNGSFDGVTGYVFSKDPVLSLPGPILVLTDEPEVPSAADAASEFARGLTAQTLGTEPACFLEGTRLLTPYGEVKVEDLRIGDRVVTATRDVAQVKWIGRQNVSTRFGASERLQPVRIAVGALGDGVPSADLTVTADHAMLVDGVLCNASALVNGTTITRVPLAEIGETYTVYHVETEAHEIILANGAPAETFIDNVSRRAFDNYAEFEALYGDVADMEELPLPRAATARQVPTFIRKSLGRPAVA